MNRPRPWISTHASQEWESAVYLIRAAQEPMIVLRALAEIERENRKLMALAASEARQQGATWDEIAEALRVSKQAAHRRFSGDSQSGPSG